jgi:hypothetical protein
MGYVHKEYMDEYNGRTKLQVIEHYGSCCSWPNCGVKDIVLLTTDHIKDGGNKHRKKVGCGNNFYRWLIKHKFPKGFQILCWNHQHLKRLESNKTGHKQTYNAVMCRNRLHKRKVLVILHYGGKCACCGESRIEFLTIDHINGGGCKHRRRIRGIPFYQWLIKHGLPKGYRVLCLNCNAKYWINGGRTI